LLIDNRGAVNEGVGVVEGSEEKSGDEEKDPLKAKLSPKCQEKEVYVEGALLTGVGVGGTNTGCGC
jgi:hypothetical protein